MPLLRAHNIALSLDGYGAGAGQTVDAPMGEGGHQLHSWFFPTPTFQRMIGKEPDPAAYDPVDEQFAAAGDVGVGATVMGRNMFGPVRGEWGDSDWEGWWGPEPPYGHDVFVLTHHARDPLPVGRTTFHFVTDGVASAVEQAFAAAGGADVRVGGGMSVLRQCLSLGLLDELHVAVGPLLLGAGERLWEDGAGTGLRVAEHVASSTVTHVKFVRA